jgi:hypothetical protein
MRMGQVHSVDDLKKLFARSYSYWTFTPDGTFGDPSIVSSNKESGRYVEQTSGVGLWGLPTVYCNGTTRLTSTNGEYCKVKPIISNITTCNNERCSIPSGPSPVVANSDPMRMSKSTPVKLTFNVALDQDQLPIRALEIFWGDGSETSYSGAALLDRPSTSTPFTFYHYYDRSKVLSNCNGAGAGYCKVNIRITDNWNAQNISVETGPDIDAVDNISATYYLVVDH